MVALARTAATARALQDLGAEPMLGQVEEAGTWDRIEECAAIVHAAALVYAGEDWNAYQRVNVESTRLAAQRARALGVPLIHVSSVAVYGGSLGASPPESVTAQAPIGSLTGGAYYARSKRLREGRLGAALQRDQRRRDEW